MPESNMSVRDWCISCGHYHIPTDWHKKARFCTVAAADPEECSCTPKRFAPRSNKGQFA